MEKYRNVTGRQKLSRYLIVNTHDKEIVGTHKKLSNAFDMMLKKRAAYEMLGGNPATVKVYDALTKSFMDRPYDKAPKLQIWQIIKKHQRRGNYIFQFQNGRQIRKGQSIYNIKYQGKQPKGFHVNPNFVNVSQLNRDLASNDIKFTVNNVANYSPSYPGRRRYEMIYQLTY